MKVGQSVLCAFLVGSLVFIDLNVLARESSILRNSGAMRFLRILFLDFFRRGVVPLSKETPFADPVEHGLLLKRRIFLNDAASESLCSVLSTDEESAMATRAARRQPEYRAVDITCPTEKNLDNSDKTYNARIKKYSQRGDEAQARCMSTLGMWGNDWSKEHKCIIKFVAKQFDLRPGAKLLDWGCGCGHSLTTFKQLFDVDGVGIDFLVPVIEWAKQHSIGQFCAVDGVHLDWLPSDYFDIVFSVAALYHIPDDKQCHVLREMYRILQPGGNIFIGWMGTQESKNRPPHVWFECKLPALAEVQVLSEQRLYPNEEFQKSGFRPNSHWGLLGQGLHTVQNISSSSYAIFLHKGISIVP